MEKKYCKITGTNVIYEVVQVSGDNVKLKNKNITVNTKLSNIQFVESTNLNLPHNTSRSYNIEINNEEIHNEIMLRHMTKLEAIEELDRFIDKALAHRIPRVKIIHGRHGGVIRDAVHEFLDNHPNVLSYEYADFSEGGIGVTIALLK